MRGMYICIGSTGPSCQSFRLMLKGVYNCPNNTSNLSGLVLPCSSWFVACTVSHYFVLVLSETTQACRDRHYLTSVLRRAGAFLRRRTVSPLLPLRSLLQGEARDDRPMRYVANPSPRRDARLYLYMRVRPLQGWRVLGVSAVRLD